MSREECREESVTGFIRRFGHPPRGYEYLEEPKEDDPVARRDDVWDTHTAQVCHSMAPWGMTEHLKVRRRDGGDGITWDALQQIKNELLGEDVLAVEIYPASHDVVNEANIRHLWAIPRGMLPSL